MTGSNDTQLSGFKFKPKFKPRNVELSELTSLQKKQKIDRKEEFDNRMKKIEERKVKKQVYTQNQLQANTLDQEFQVDNRQVTEKIDLQKFKFDKQLEISDMPLKELLHKIHKGDMPVHEAKKFNEQIHVLCMPPLPKLSGNGLVGKIRCRKSGSCELVIGDMVFDLSMGIQSQMLQKVIQTQIFGESKLVDFGDVTGKIVASIRID